MGVRPTTNFFLTLGPAKNFMIFVLLKKKISELLRHYRGEGDRVSGLISTLQLELLIVSFPLWFLYLCIMWCHLRVVKSEIHQFHVILIFLDFRRIFLVFLKNCCISRPFFALYVQIRNKIRNIIFLPYISC